MESFIFILFREKLGTRLLIETARDELSPKVRILQTPWSLIFIKCYQITIRLKALIKYCCIDEVTAA